MLLACALLVTFMSARTTLALASCKISEFACRNNRCIRLDRYCDGINHCGDKSDEPPYCSGCNRTYYGDERKTYDLELAKPRTDRVPFLCHLTFTANGHTHGDFIQILFDAFNVGRFDNRSYDGCPDGYMQIMELGRPFTGGSWCGPSSGLTVYYSETNTITVTVKLYHAMVIEDFKFSIRYRFVSDEEAVARFGSPSAPLNRGEVVPGTYCSKNFYECYKQRCRLQSPNYPGMYPRNVTCLLTVKQKELPKCKQALISISQNNPNKMQIKRSVAVASMNKTKALRTWNECSSHRDHLVFYDGPTTDDSVLVRFCGGDWLPSIISRGPEMLVAFHSSPFSATLSAATGAESTTVRGFELDVAVVFVDSDSLDFSREPRRCEFWVNASSPDGDEVSLRSKGRSGYLVSPRHTLPPNTTCTWHFVGKPTDRVWIYFLSFTHERLTPVETSPTTVSKQSKGRGSASSNKQPLTHKCLTRLRIWDGGGRDGKSNIIGDYCEGEQLRLCDHTSLSNLTRPTRPCTAAESYTTTGSEMTIKLSSEEGTALAPTSFRLWYEFVDTRLGGEPMAESPLECTRLFRRVRKGQVHSPRNIFLYGKGGAVNLTCVYRIEASPSERIKLTILNASFGDNGCLTDLDVHSARPQCVHDSAADRSVDLRVFESSWKQFALPYACFCDNTTIPSRTEESRPFTLVSSSSAIEIHFRITKFNITEDYTHLYFHAEYELTKSAECTRRQKLRGSGGEIAFTNPPVSTLDLTCSGIPWVVEAKKNASLFLLTWGVFLNVEPTAEELNKCPTRNRILIYSGKPLRLLKVVCPMTPNSRYYAVHIFSEEWFVGPSIPVEPGRTLHLAPPHSPSFLVEFLGFEAGVAQVNWLEISRTRSSYLNALQLDMPSRDAYNGSLLPVDCAFKCPELNACISETLWCDGRNHCPSGYDEFEIHCGVGHKFISLIPGGMYALLGVAAAIITFFTLFVALVVAFNVKKGPKDDNLYQGGFGGVPPRRVPTDELLLDPSSSSSS